MELVKENINIENVNGDYIKCFSDREEETELLLKGSSLRKGMLDDCLKSTLNDNDPNEEFELVPFIKEEPLGIWENHSMDLETLDDESEQESLRMNELDFNHSFTDWISASTDDNCSDNQESYLLDAMPSEFIKCETAEEIDDKIDSHSENLFADSLWMDYASKKLENSSDVEDVNSKEVDSNRLFICQICKKHFNDRMFLYNHLKEFHQCNIIFECDTCRKIFLNKPSLIAHLNTHSKRKHPAKKPDSLNSDSDNSEEPLQTMVSCEICGKHFVEKLFLYNHLKAYHHCNIIFECDTCRKIFLNDKSLILHLETHSKKKKRAKVLQCEICSKKFSWEVGLDQHRLQHYLERSYVCNVCSKRFSLESELELHKVSHSSDGLLQCNICRRKFARQCNLVQHKRVHSRHPALKC